MSETRQRTYLWLLSFFVRYILKCGWCRFNVQLYKFFLLSFVPVADGVVDKSGLGVVRWLAIFVLTELNLGRMYKCTLNYVLIQNKIATYCSPRDSKLHLLRIMSNCKLIHWNKLFVFYYGKTRKNYVLRHNWSRAPSATCIIVT